MADLWLAFETRPGPTKAGNIAKGSGSKSHQHLLDAAPVAYLFPLCSMMAAVTPGAVKAWISHSNSHSICP